MKKLKIIRRAEGMNVENAVIDKGGFGNVTINGWTGSVVFSYNEGGWEHVSVAPYDGHTPTWDEMCQIKDIFFDDEEVVLQFHPKKSQYVNMMGNSLHLWRPKDKSLLKLLEERY